MSYFHEGIYQNFFHVDGWSWFLSAHHFCRITNEAGNDFVEVKGQVSSVEKDEGVSIDGKGYRTDKMGNLDF